MTNIHTHTCAFLQVSAKCRYHVQPVVIHTIHGNILKVLVVIYLYACCSHYVLLDDGESIASKTNEN